MTIQIETIRTNDFSMDYFRFGHGKKTLVILPGLSVESVMHYADAVAEAYSLLNDEYTVYVLDRRKELPAAYSVYRMAEDTAAAIRALGLDKVRLFGASQGGMIAMVIAIEQPELVSMLVLGSASACIKQEQYQVIDSWIRLAAAGDAKKLYLAFGEAIYPREVFDQSKDLLVAAAGTVSGEDLHRFVILAEAIRDFDVTDQLQKIACPVLVIGSGDDRVLGANAPQQIAEGLKNRQNTELYMYNGYGHAAYDTAPDYRKRILRFLSEKSVD